MWIEERHTVVHWLRTGAKRECWRPMSDVSEGRRKRSARVPPHNLDAEASLLGALLLSKDALTAVTETGITSSDFYKPAHQHVYEAVRVLAVSGEPVDVVTVAEELRRNDLID